MKNKLTILLLTFFIALVTAACGAENSTTKENANNETNDTETASTEKTKELTINHQLGETVVPKNPKKIVVFDFGILDSLDKLDVPVSGVPQANVPPYLSKYEDASSYENVGSLKEPDFEKIYSMAPDLIIISGRQTEAYEELSKIAPTIFLGVDTSRYMDSYKENMETIGEIFGKENQVETELANVEKAINTLHEKASALDKTSLIILINEGNISAYGPGSRFGILHDQFGFTPADDSIEVSTHGQNVSFEYIMEKNPDYLFVIDRGSAVEGESTAKTLLDNDLMKQVNAVKEDNVIYLDPNYWYLSGGGLTSVSEMVKEVEKVLE
jgi:iron complex transport system substrate-binding protein